MNESNAPDNAAAPNARRKSNVPPELQFMVQLPKLADMGDEEIIAFMNDHLAKLRGVKDSLRAIGLDPEWVIAAEEARVQNFVEKARSADEAVEKHLQAAADLAEAEVALFKTMQSVVRQAQAEKPFDPQVQEWLEQLEAWQQHLPKE